MSKVLCVIFVTVLFAALLRPPALDARPRAGGFECLGMVQMYLCGFVLLVVAIDAIVVGVVVPIAVVAVAVVDVIEIVARCRRSLFAFLRWLAGAVCLCDHLLEMAMTMMIMMAVLMLSETLYQSENLIAH